MIHDSKNRLLTYFELTKTKSAKFFQSTFNCPLTSQYLNADRKWESSSSQLQTKDWHSWSCWHVP